MASDKDRFDRIPIILQFPESPKFAETYGFAGTQGFVALEGQRFVPHASRSSETVYIFMHPSSTLQLLPMPAALANAGLHVVCAGSRYPKNDSALIMEKVCFDLGQYVKWAKQSCGYKKVVLVGWSGGGSLSLFYQSQAENPSITHTPAGDEYDLTAAKLIPADGIVFIAAHLSRAETLTEWLDPSVRDELNPDDRDLELDIYDPACPNRPPFSKEFVARFRAAQIARSRKITSWAEHMLATLKGRNTGEVERGFVVHRTMCDVRWIDPSLDPNGRKPNHCFLGEPRTANSAPAGLARFSTLRSWLSQWSYDRSQAKGTLSAPRIKHTPVLQIENEADDAVPATHNPTIFAALATPEKELVVVKGATHYYVGQPAQLKQCIDTLLEWSSRKQLIEPDGASRPSTVTRTPPKIEFLFDLHAWGQPHDLGKTPYGKRRFVQITGGRFEGPGMRGEILPVGSDIALIRDDGVFEPNVNMVLKTDDGALIYVKYHGRFHASAPVMAKLLSREEPVDPDAYYLRNAVFFETSAEPYLWLNGILAISKGETAPVTEKGIGILYKVFKVL